MAVKKIKLTRETDNKYESLKNKDKEFSKTRLNLVSKKSLKDFFGVLSKDSGERLEKAIKETRKKHTESYRKRVNEITKALEECH